jgi:ferredoxin
MKIQVDYTKCTGHGVCESFAPSLFEINHDGDVVRHRLSRAGNRQLNCCLHVMAIIQVRQDTPGRAYYLRKRSEGKSHNEAMRCLKRRLSDLVYRRLIHDADERKAGPVGHSGAVLSSRAAGPTPRTNHPSINRVSSGFTPIMLPDDCLPASGRRRAGAVFSPLCARNTGAAGSMRPHQN